MENFAGKIFLSGVGSLRSDFDHLNPFSKLTTTFHKYLTSIKIKISMTFMYKDHEVKIKMVQEHWLQLRVKFLFCYNMKTVIKWRKN